MKKAILRVAMAYDPNVKQAFAVDLDGLKAVDHSGVIRHHSEAEIPVLVDHNPDRRIGVVRKLFTHREIGGLGLWVCALVDLEDAPGWVKRGRGASWGYRKDKRNVTVRHLTSALVEEVSVLIGDRPAEPLAQVVWVGEAQDSSPAAGSTTSNRASSSAMTYDYRPPVWDELERIVGYRITDENQHQAFLEASRTPIEKLYDEVMASRRQAEPQVLIRPGIGQVLGVR